MPEFVLLGAAAAAAVITWIAFPIMSSWPRQSLARRRDE